MPTLREIREANYISRKELADMADVSESTIVRIETPGHRVTREIAEKVLRALSKRIGRPVTPDEAGIITYNVMRDRRQRAKNNGVDEAA